MSFFQKMTSPAAYVHAVTWHRFIRLTKKCPRSHLYGNLGKLPGKVQAAFFSFEF